MSKSRYLKQDKTQRVINPETAVEALCAQGLHAAEQEECWVLHLDGANRIAGIFMIHRGTEGEVKIHPRDVFREAVRRNAASIVVAHNHLGGSRVPSDEDVVVMRELHAAGELLGIDLVDALIITESEYTSFMREGLLPTKEGVHA